MKQLFSWRKRWLVGSVGVAIVALCIIGLFFSQPHTTFVFPHSHDWDLRLSWSQAVRATVLRYHQFPLWNPYRCGGAPLLGEPESDIFSLYAPFLFVFGPATGYLIVFFFYMLLGIYGLNRLASHVGISKAGSVLSGVGIFLFWIIYYPVRYRYYKFSVDGIFSICRVVYRSVFTILESSICLVFWWIHCAYVSLRVSLYSHRISLCFCCVYDRMHISKTDKALGRGWNNSYVFCGFERFKVSSNS